MNYTFIVTAVSHLCWSVYKKQM